MMRTLLDISLFAEGALNVERLLAPTRESRFALEIPAALLEMVEQSLQTESSLLSELIYAYKKKAIKSYMQDRVARRIKAKLVGKAHIETRLEAETIKAVQQLQIVLGPYVRSRERPLEERSTTGEISLERPISLYHAPKDFGDWQLRTRLRQAYQEELDLPPHPLLDRYYLEVLHSLAVGTAHSERVRRIMVSAGDMTLRIISQASQAIVTNLDRLPQPPARAAAGFAREYIQAQREFVREFVSEEYKPFLREKGFEILLTLALQPQLDPNIPIELLFSTAAYFFTMGYAPHMPNPWARAAVIATPFAALVLCAFLSRVWASLPLFRKSTLTSTPKSTVQALDAAEGMATPVVELTPTAEPTPTLLPTLEPTVTPLPTLPPRIAPPVVGFYHTVRTGDTLYSLARGYGTTVEAIAVTNHLADLNYIQIGQVLYIPSVPSP